MNRSKEQLFELAKNVAQNAHAPYSKFAVGAALVTSQNKIYCGTNVENASFPEGWCAETSAIAAMVSDGAAKENATIAEMAIFGKQADFLSPCGGCRQRILEFADENTKIHLYNSAGKSKTLTIDQLLPAAFSSDAL